MHTDDVILAVASPPGRSLRGIVRICGPGTLALIDQTVRSREGNSLPHSRGMHIGRFTLNQRHLPVIALLMPAPHSYTGEDSAEIQMPGNPALLEMIMQALLDAAAALNIAARRAEGGEFTARAFFNNKISLTQAEGVAATIAAVSDAELRAANELRSGALGTLAHQLADELASALALVEAGIDFTDQEDVVAITPADLQARLQLLSHTLCTRMERSVGMEQLEAIPWVVLTGPPNAGKSTLFNALLGRERAVVSDVAGTTRDVLAEPLRIDTPRGSAEVMLADVAGDEQVGLLDAAALEPMMQQAAAEARARAELLLACTPAGTSEKASFPRGQAVLTVATKCDLASSPDSHASADADVRVSAVTGMGLDALRSAIADHLAERAVSLSGDIMALTPRHEAALRSASGNILEAEQLVRPQRDRRDLADAEIIASFMRAALNDLAALAGDITPDDVLGRVFSTFCVGK